MLQMLQNVTTMWTVQLFALANGDRIKEKQRGKNAFVVDTEKKRAAEELLGSLTANHRDLLSQVRRIYRDGCIEEVLGNLQISLHQQCFACLFSVLLAHGTKE